MAQIFASSQNKALTLLACKARERVLKMSCHARSAHAGSALSCIEILTSLFNRKVTAPNTLEKIILSKGHAAMALYATAEQFGLIPNSELDAYLENGTKLWGHPSRMSGFDWIDWSTGSLGHGLPAAIGLAYARKLRKENSTVAVVLSDGECDEGSNWEAALFAGHHKLSNLNVFIDYNKIQSLDFVTRVMSLEPFAEKWRAFNWECIEVDGHSIDQLTSLWDRPTTSGQPRCVICHTTKGKGVPEIENTVLSHYRPISKEQVEAFCNEK